MYPFPRTPNRILALVACMAVLGSIAYITHGPVALLALIAGYTVMMDWAVND